jgi:hypothetical protein
MTTFDRGDMTPEEMMAMGGFEGLGQDPIVTNVTPELEIFDDEGSMVRNVIGGGGVLLGGLALADGAGMLPGSDFNPDKISVGLLGTGGGLAIQENDMARMWGRGLIMAGIIYEGAVRVGLVDRFLA